MISSPNFNFNNSGIDMKKNHDKTLMELEAREAPTVVKQQLQLNKEIVHQLAQKVPLDSINLIVTCARGSSDHAAAYAKYLFELMLGIPVVSIGPSIGSIYKRPMNLKNSLFITISQSGKSPDLVSCSEWAKSQGAFVVGLINEQDSPMAEIADLVLPLHAGSEKSVAATKSYIASLSAIAHIASTYSDDLTFTENLYLLPEKLEKSCQLDWSEATTPLAATDDLMVVGRGVGFGIALEAALKFKETSSIHAEAFSSAELMHGPLALIRKRYPILAFSQDDETGKGVDEIVAALKDKGARVYIAQTGKSEKGRLPVVEKIHPFLAPVTFIQRFYLMVNEIALARGFDPDNPEHLKKVTETK